MGRSVPRSRTAGRWRPARPRRAGRRCRAHLADAVAAGEVRCAQRGRACGGGGCGPGCVQARQEQGRSEDGRSPPQSLWHGASRSWSVPVQVVTEMNGTGWRRALTKQAGSSAGTTGAASPAVTPRQLTARPLNQPARYRRAQRAGKCGIPLPHGPRSEVRIAASDGSRPARYCSRVHRRVGWPTPDRAEEIRKLPASAGATKNAPPR